MYKAVGLIAGAAVLCGCGDGLPGGAGEFVSSGCKRVHKDEQRTFFNCPGDIKTFRDTIAIPVAKKQGATLDPRYVMIYKKGTYTIAATRGQYAVVDEEAEADSKKPGYALMILTYKRD